MKRLFTKEWQDYASKIPVIGVGDAHRNDHPDRRPSVSVRQAGYSPPAQNSGRDLTKRKAESRNTIPEFELGDTVKTLLGYGKIVKIDGDQCLVAMENQIARIWERRSTLVKVEKLPPHMRYR
jgi:hypothetical protein